MLVLTSAAFCAPIIFTFTFTGTATGTLGSTAFTASSYTVTSFADRSIVSFAHATYSVTAINSSISIAGLAGMPLLTFTYPIFWTDPQGAGDSCLG